VRDVKQVLVAMDHCLPKKSCSLSADRFGGKRGEVLDAMIFDYYRCPALDRHSLAMLV